MKAKTNTVIELEQEGRYSEAGYGRLFAYNSLHFNAMVDARTKAKYIRELNPDTTEDTQKNILYSGPTVFFRPEINIIDHEIDKMDIKSAYPAYLINEQIQKPGIFRIRHLGAFPLSDRVALYVIKFNCDTNNLFVKWFLNSSAVTMKKIKTDGSKVWGSVGIFSSTWMNLIKYVNKFLTTDEGLILKTYTFHGSNTVEITQSQIEKLYNNKEDGSKNAKNMLVQSTGWLSLIDKPTYYHMVQYIKYHLLKTIYDHEIEDDLIGIQTDCLFFRVTEKTEQVHEIIEMENISVAKRLSSIGTYTFQRVQYDDIITNKARVVLKNG
jgi:hypothetical protein